MENINIQSESKITSSNTILFIVLLVLSAATAAIFTFYGSRAGVIPLVVTVALVFVYIVIKEPKFAVLSIMVLSYFIMFIISYFNTSLPLGTIMDGMLAVMILGFFIQQKYRRNYWIFKNPISYIILIWVSYNVLQFFNLDAASKLAWVYTIRNVAAVMLSYFIFTYYLDSRKFLRTIIILWLSLSFFAALYAIKQEYFGFFAFEERNHYDPATIGLMFIDGHWRKSSIFSDPVSYSFNMAISSLLCIGLLTGPFKLKTKLILAFLAMLFAWVMPYSGTRAAYVLIPAALSLFFILKLSRIALVLSLPVAFAFLILIKVPTNNRTLARFQSAFRPNNDASFNVRKLNQKKVQPFIQTHPFGGGLGGSGIWGYRFAPNSFLAQFPPDSGYVRVAMELGWVGLLIICGIMFTSLYVGIKNFFEIRDPELKSYCLAMVLIVFALTIANYPQEAIVQYPMSIYFYMILAIITVSKVLDNQINDGVIKLEVKEEKKVKKIDYRVV
ncbi:O-antigen ligase family protein [Pedobacter alpinus]|uniref:O-antigen ligase family protein n=1 Tax=Pedobacter alpinus TaxID=1590643 RepID=A0ABW5TR36_9SPHI